MSKATPVSSKRVTLNGNNHFLVDVHNIAQTNASTLATEDRMNRTSGTGRDRDYNVWEASRDEENPSQLPGEASVPPNKNDAYSTEKRSYIANGSATRSDDTRSASWKQDEEDHGGTRSAFRSRPASSLSTTSIEVLSSYMNTKGAVWPLSEGDLEPGDPNNPDNRSIMSLASSEFPRADSDINDADDEGGEEKPLVWRELTRDQILVLFFTSFTNLLGFLSLSILAPFFPLEADLKNVNTTISGWIFGVFALVQFLSSPLFGRLLPVVGSRFMFNAGMFICGGCTLLFGILDKVDTRESIVTFVVLCFVTRVLLALGSTALQNAGFVILVKSFPNNVSTVVGISEIFVGIGMVTGPALGGFLYAAGGFILPFAVIGGICFTILPFSLAYLPPQDDTQEADEDVVSLRHVLLHPRSVVNSIVVIIAALVWAVLDPTLEPHLREYNLGPELVGVMFLIMAAVYSVTSPVWGRLADYLPDNRTLLIPGLLFAALGLLLLGPSPVLGFDSSFNSLWLTIVALVVLGLSASMCVIPTYDIYIDVLKDLDYPTDTRTYGMVSGLWVSMYALGDFLGPTIGGYLFDEIGFVWLMTWVAGFCIVTTGLVVLTWFFEKRCCFKKSHYVNDHTDDVNNVHDVEEKTPLIHQDDTTNSMRSLPPGFLFNESTDVENSVSV